MEHQKELIDLLMQLREVCRDQCKIDQLKKINECEIVSDSDKFILMRKQCYYGGCGYDPQQFENEYEAEKTGAEITLINKSLSLLHKETSQNLIADMNTDCKHFMECSGKG